LGRTSVSPCPIHSGAQFSEGVAKPLILAQIVSATAEEAAILKKPNSERLDPLSALTPRHSQNRFGPPGIGRPGIVLVEARAERILEEGLQWPGQFVVWKI